MQTIADAIPFTWALDLLRAALLGGDVDATRLVALIASVALLLPLALALFGSSLQRARRTGTLALY